MHPRTSLPFARLAVAIAILGPPASAQMPPASAPTCAQTLDSLDAKLRQNYAGFHLEIVGARRAMYDAQLAEASGDARRRALDECLPVLQRFLAWFADPHLFVFQAAGTDSATAARRQRSLRLLALDEPSLRRDLVARRDRLDPLEGIWSDGATRLGVVRDPEAKGDHFVAILLASDTAGWPAGAVRAGFIRQSDGSYAVTLLTKGFAELRLTARIHRRTLLRLSPGIWGKQYPLSAEDEGTLDPRDARRPRITIRERSVVVSVPSHDPVYRRLLDSAVTAADTAIRRTRLLIVDLRGNEGGSAQTTRVLDSYVASSPRRPTPYDSGAAVMLSSPAQIAYAKRAFGAETTAFVRSLVRRLEERPGALVPLDETPAPPAREFVREGDWRVVVLVDRGTVSASEVLVLRASRSTRAVVLGEPTAGALDYQSTQIVRLGTGDARWALGYPTIAASALLPRGGMRGHGIAPTVFVDWSRVADPILHVERSYGFPAPP